MAAASKVLSIEEIFTPLAHPNVDALGCPFGYIDYQKDYEPAEFIRGLPSDPPIEVMNFGEEHIEEYFWIHPGENDEDAWHCLGRLKDQGKGSYYFYYTASCDYTGFDCQGSMRMFVSKDKKKLWEEGMTAREREALIADR